MKSCFELLLTALMFFNGFESIHTSMSMKIITSDTNDTSTASIPNDTVATTELAQNISTLYTATEVNKPARSKCDRSQQEECCTSTVVNHFDYKKYIDMSARGRHTVVNMTSAGLQEYTMYFAVRGEDLVLLLSPMSPTNWNLMYYAIGLSDERGIDMWERLPTVPVRSVHDLNTTNIISTEHYTYHYVTISGDTIEVGRRGEPPLMKYTSTELKKLKYFSFMSRGSIDGTALYDCTAE